MGSLFKSKTKTTQQPFETNPWDPQQDYLKYGFEQGKGQLDSALAGLSGITDPVADMNQGQLNAISQGYSQGMDFANAGQSLANHGAGLMGNLNTASNNTAGIDAMANSMAQGSQGYANQMSGIGNQIANQATSAGNQLRDLGSANRTAGVTAGNNIINQASVNKQAGVSGANQIISQSLNDRNAGINAYNNINNSIGNNQQANLGDIQGVSANAANIGQQAAGIPGSLSNSFDQLNANASQVTQNANGLFNNGSISGVLSDANQVANNPYLQNQIDSAIGDVQRGFQNTQAGINSAASGAGGMNSTRAGLLESKALESAQRQASDISSGMRMDAYNKGLDTSLQNKSQNNQVLGTMLNAGQQGLAINDQQLNAQNMSLGHQLSANAQGLSAAGMSNDARNTAVQQQLATAQGSADVRNAATSAGLSANAQANDARNSAAQQAIAGYGMAQDARNTSFDQHLAGANLGINGLNAQADIANSAGALSLSGQQAGANTTLANNDFRAQLGQIGAQNVLNGYDLSTQGNQNAFNYATALQNQQQNEIDGQLNFNAQGMNLVQQYMNAIGGNYGQNGYTTDVSKSASPFQQIAGAASTVLGGMKSFG